MSLAKDDGLTLQEAAALVGRTTKTLYRWMDKGSLSFHLNEAGRRLINRSELLEVATRSMGARARSGGDDTMVIKLLLKVVDRLERQELLIVGLIELYQPESIGALNRKRQLLR